MYGDSKPRVSYKMTIDEIDFLARICFLFIIVTGFAFLVVSIAIVFTVGEFTFEYLSLAFGVGLLAFVVGIVLGIGLLIRYIGRISIEKSLTEADELETFREVSIESEYGREILKKTKEVIYDKVKTKNIINFCEEKDVKIKRCYQGNECIVEGYYYLQNEEGFQKLYNYRVSFIIERCYKFEVNDEVVFENNELYEESKFYNYMHFRRRRRKEYIIEKDFDNYFLIKLIGDKWVHIHFEVTDDGVKERKLVNEVIFHDTPEVLKKWIMWSREHIERYYNDGKIIKYSELEDIDIINYYNKSENVIKGYFFIVDNNVKKKYNYEFVTVDGDSVVFRVDEKVIVAVDDYNKRLDKIKKLVLKK